MRTVSVFVVMVAMTTALAETLFGNYTMHKLGKRDLLLRSKRRWVLSTIEIVEEQPGPFPKDTAQMFNDMTNEDFKNHKFQISGMGVTDPPLGVFSIDEHTGMVSVLKPIDREKYSLFHIKFDILNRVTKQPIDKTLAFDVKVMDINDNSPIFEKKVMTAIVPENKEEGYLPVQLTASDIDEYNTVNSTFTISVLSQDPKEPKFGVIQLPGAKSGHLNFSGCFDYDKAQNYKIIVQAKDHGIKPNSSTAVVNLRITDANTHAPTFKAKEYRGSVLEMESNKEVLRVSVEDKDTPNTPAWRAKYSFIKGNEDENYKIETDPKTNDGILTVIKGKDFERTTLATLEIAVENEEPLFVCHAKSKGAAKPPANSVNVMVKVIDVNDPPVFDKDVTNVYQREEEKPGKVLHTPKVTDVDSNMTNIRFELIKDPAGWVTIDKKTGQIKSAKKMDRESPFVENNIYKILITAIDDGEPPATGTGTVLIHLGDVNDNLPKLVNQSIIMCINKHKTIMVPVEDSDAAPFGGPFTFSLGGKDVKTLKQRWKLDPATGEVGGLVCLKNLAYGNYSVPLTIQDQQGAAAHETLEVVVCDCLGGEVCRGKLPAGSRFGAPGIGLIFAGLLLFLLLLLVIFCECGGKALKHIAILEDEGNQTLIKYNEEGGGSTCQAEPTLHLTSSNSVKLGTMQMPQMSQIMTEDIDMYRSSGRTLTSMVEQQNALAMANDTWTNQGMANDSWTNQGMANDSWTNQGEQSMTSMAEQQHGMGMANDTWTNQGGRSMYSMRNTNRMNSYRTNSSRYSQPFSLMSNQHITDHLDRKLYMIAGDHLDYPAPQPHVYAYEGQGSKCHSLDKLSLSNLGDDLEFVNNLGPRFKTLGGICHQTMQKKNTQL